MDWPYPEWNLGVNRPAPMNCRCRIEPVGVPRIQFDIGAAVENGPQTWGDLFPDERAEDSDDG